MHIYAYSLAFCRLGIPNLVSPYKIIFDMTPTLGEFDICGNNIAVKLARPRSQKSIKLMSIFSK